MPTLTTTPATPTTARSTLHIALDLGNSTCKLAFATAITRAPHPHMAPACDLDRHDTEMVAVKVRFGLGADAPVVSCYQAGRNGF